MQTKTIKKFTKEEVEEVIEFIRINYEIIDGDFYKNYQIKNSKKVLEE